jgi:hypothetical protein
MAGFEVITEVIGIAFVPAFVTPFEMAAQSGRATRFDSAQDTLLRGRQRGCMRLAKFLTAGAHNIGDFERGSHWETQCGL